ncbi:outer-membrane lipoprotein carrier protein LolA [Rhodoblastus sp.]|uniref:outer-membrane lipoprotein carrier protein LolA n=1 Tax=Rhodoblastus sp. TaxID=1962975 RepID=UPI003F9D8B65
MRGIYQPYGLAKRAHKLAEGLNMKSGMALFFGLMLFVTASGSSQAQKVQPPEKKASSKLDDSKASPATLDPQIAIQMADDYFNAARVMTADFVQVGADGRRSEGKLYISKPGRLRFEYALPATMEIIADGTSVAIRDRKLQTQQIYFIGQTPLKFLLKEQLSLKRDVKIIDVVSDARSTTITLEDSATFGGTSKIKINFDNKDFSLKQWEVTDPQGYQTLVTLHNIDLKSVPNVGLFRIPSDSIWPSQN